MPAGTSRSLRIPLASRSRFLRRHSFRCGRFPSRLLGCLAIPDTTGFPRFARLTDGWRRWWRTTGPQFLLKKNLRQTETPAGQFPGVIVRKQFHSFLTHLSKVNVPRLPAEIINRHARTVLRLAALTVLLAAAILVLTAQSFLLAPLLLLLTPLRFLLAALMLMLPPLLLLLLPPVHRRALSITGRSVAGRFGRGEVVCGSGMLRRLRVGCLLCHDRLRDLLDYFHRKFAGGFFGIGVHISRV